MSFKPTRKQKVLYKVLPLIENIIIKLKKLHRKLSNVGIEEHPCWAGGFNQGEGGICAQPCNSCQPFYDALKRMRNLK